MTVRWLAFLLALVAAVPARAEEAPRFVAARYDEKVQIVRFESPIEIDWKTAARTHFKRFDFEHPTAKDIDDLREKIYEISGDAEEVFSFTPPVGGRAMSYSLISAHGIEPLLIAAFEGTIRFSFDHAKPPNLVSTSYFGGAISQRGVGGGGFALLSRHDTRPDRIDGAQITIARGADGVTLAYSDDEGRASTAFPAKWHDKFEAAFGLRVGGRRYLFVDWPPDTAGYEALCENTFTLHEVGATLEHIASNDYDCDP